MDAKPMPTLTVVVPCYNRQEELVRSLDSLVEQSDPDFDVIVCDDGSTEDIQGVVARFSDRLKVRCVSIENSGGPARPRNIGVDLSDAEWISFLDSDDWWFPERMARVRAALSGEIDFLYHPLRKVACPTPGVRGEPLPEFVAHAMKAKDPLRAMILEGNPIATSGATVRRAALLSAGGFCDERSLSSVEDFDLWLRMAAQGCRFGYLSEVLGAYCVGGDQISVFDKRQYERQRTLFERQLNFLPPAYHGIASDRFQYLLGGYAQRLGMPIAGEHLRNVGFQAGFAVWAKARLKQAWPRHQG